MAFTASGPSLQQSLRTRLSSPLEAHLSIWPTGREIYTAIYKRVLCSGHCVIPQLPTQIDLILGKTQTWRNSYYAHFTQQGTAAQREQMTDCPGSHGQKVCLRMAKSRPPIALLKLARQPLTSPVWQAEKQQRAVNIGENVDTHRRGVGFLQHIMQKLLKKGNTAHKSVYQTYMCFE